MELDGEARFETLSSGMKRRVLLAKALVGSPDLLLLDEPTNHLDIASIEWLENFLARWPKAFMFITHDRAFLRKLASRILEIENGRLFDWSCDYETFLKRKEESLAAEEKQNALFDKKLAQEEVWIRQGIKARRTRNEGRVRALKERRLQRAERREKVGTANLRIQEGIRSGNLVVEAKDISVAFGDRSILDGFSTTIMRGDKVGIIGRNGAGKTTLLRTLLGELKPDQGSIRLGTNLQVAYFDQLRGQLDAEKTIEEEVGDGYKTVEINGKPTHIIVIFKTSSSLPHAHEHPSNSSAAVNAIVFYLPNSSLNLQTSSSSTNPPTTSMPKLLKCSKNGSLNTKARCLWSATTASS